MAGITEWDLMAYDITDLLDKNAGEYGGDLDLDQNAVEPNLPAFIAACQATQAELDAKETEST